MLRFGWGKSRRVAIAIAGVLAGAALGGAAGAAADPLPPNCTAADLAGVSAGVAAATAVYLFTHPDVNDYFTGLKGQGRGDFQEDLRDYMDANPQIHAELQHIRQPLTDLQNRCR